MMDLAGPLKGVTDRDAWSTRGASFKAKLVATKEIWLPPTPSDAPRKAGSAARGSKKAASTRKRATKKASGTATKAASTRKKQT